MPSMSRGEAKLRSDQIMNNKYCEYCWPTKRKYHFVFHLEYYLSKFATIFSKPLKYLFPKKKKINQDYLWGPILEFLSLVKIVNFIDEPDETKLYNRGLIFFKEAKKRNLDIKAIKFLGKYINEFRLIYKGKRYYYEGIPLTINQKCLETDDKIKIKTLLYENNIPIAPGKFFTDPKKAIDFGKKTGYPLVVKPNTGSLSHHLTCFINSEEELRKAIKISKIYRPDFIVERYIEGNLYRATVTGRKHVFICQKDKANIVGNGFSSIEELIKIKNNGKKRGEIHQMNTTLHKIPIDDALKRNLKTQGLNLKSILPKGKKIYLQDKFILSQGCDIINCSEDAHLDNKNLFLKIANILETDLAGIDFICGNINKSYKNQETAVLEINSLPYIDMHQYPSHGKPDPVAEIVWDIVLNNLDGEYKPQK